MEKHMSDLTQEIEQESVKQLLEEVIGQENEVLSAISKQGFAIIKMKIYPCLWGEKQASVLSDHFKEHNLQGYYIPQEKYNLFQDIFVLTPITNTIKQDLQLIKSSILLKDNSTFKIASITFICSLLGQLLFNYNIPLAPNTTIKLPFFIFVSVIAFIIAIMKSMEDKRFSEKLETLILTERVLQERG